MTNNIELLKEKASEKLRDKIEENFIALKEIISFIDKPLELREKIAKELEALSLLHIWKFLFTHESERGSSLYCGKERDKEFFSLTISKEMQDFLDTCINIQREHDLDDYYTITVYLSPSYGIYFSIGYLAESIGNLFDEFDNYEPIKWQLIDEDSIDSYGELPLTNQQIVYVLDTIENYND
jgi:hypothetical protein